MPDIPQVRGPFSFLDSIGSAASDIIGAKTKEELRRREEQQQQAAILQQLITSGSVDPSTLQGPQVQGYYAASGGIDPTKISNAPYKVKQEQAKQAPIETQSKALTLREQMRHTEALGKMDEGQLNEFYKIPSSVDVGTADDKQLAMVAKRYVYAARGDANAAFAAAQLQSTGETRGKLTQAYFGQAAAEYANEQKELDAKLLQATRLNQGRAPQELLDDFIRANIAQQNVLQTELGKLKFPGVDPGDDRRRKSLTLELQQYMAQGQILNAKMATMMGVQTAPGMTPPPGAAAPDPAVETAKRALATKQITVEDVRSSKRLTDAQKQQVLGSQPTVQASPSGGIAPPKQASKAEKDKKKAGDTKKFTDSLGLK